MLGEELEGSRSSSRKSFQTSTSSNESIIHASEVDKGSVSPKPLPSSFEPQISPSGRHQYQTTYHANLGRDNDSILAQGEFPAQSRTHPRQTTVQRTQHRPYPSNNRSAKHWQNNEIARLREALDYYEWGSWEEIAEYVETRSARGVKEYALRNERHRVDSSIKMDLRQHKAEVLLRQKEVEKERTEINLGALRTLADSAKHITGAITSAMREYRHRPIRCNPSAPFVASWLVYYWLD
jgi:hypothetical protein